MYTVGWALAAWLLCAAATWAQEGIAPGADGERSGGRAGRGQAPRRLCATTSAHPGLPQGIRRLPLLPLGCLCACCAPPPALLRSRITHPASPPPCRRRRPPEAALLALRGSITNWPAFAAANAIRGWDSSLPLCQWTGVACTPAGSVQSV